MKIKTLVLDLDFDDLVTILADFNVYGDYWCSFIDFNEKDYDEAKTLLQLRMDDDHICREHVWAEMLMNKKPLILSTYEDDETHELTLTFDNVRLATAQLIAKGKISVDMQDWDCSDCDMIVQQAVFGEVVYG